MIFIMTSNAGEEFYETLGYRGMLSRYRAGLEEAVGNTKTLIAGNTLQVKDYSRFKWDIFDPADKQDRHDKVFPKEKEKAFRLGAEMVRKAW